MPAESRVIVAQSEQLCRFHRPLQFLVQFWPGADTWTCGGKNLHLEQGNVPMGTIGASGEMLKMAQPTVCRIDCRRVGKQAKTVFSCRN